MNLPDALSGLYNEVSEKGDFSRNILYRILEETRVYNPNDFFSLKLQKHIPPGGGLGGGSSNAGVLLQYLRDKYFIPEEECRKIALKAGADVPFFLQPEPCFVSGIGEALRPINTGAGFGVLCICGIQVNTRFAYQKLKRTLQPTPCPKSLRGLDSDALDALKNSGWSHLTDLRNDFEKPVFEMHPELKKVKAGFYQNGAELSMMTGSGSTVFALVDSRQNCNDLVHKMRQEFPAFCFEQFEFPGNESRNEIVG